MSRRRIGAWGEERFMQHLQEQGYQILARNWRVPEGEVDLVEQDGDTIAFVEVKTRTTHEYGGQRIVLRLLNATVFNKLPGRILNLMICWMHHGASMSLPLIGPLQGTSRGLNIMLMLSIVREISCD